MRFRWRTRQLRVVWLQQFTNVSGLPASAKNRRRVASAEQSQQFAKWAIELLEADASRGYKNGKAAREYPDFVILHGDARFASILAQMEKHRKIHNEIWVGDREVTRGQFEQCMNDAKYATNEEPAAWMAGRNGEFNPTADHPVFTTWNEAVLYCNWLSDREGFVPCYERTGTKEKCGEYEYDAWRMIPEATGYRLLDEAEWEYACRAGTSTEFSSGNDESLLVGYCQMRPSKSSALCGEKLPNAWGLHDFHGNAYEWCWDRWGAGTSSRIARSDNWRTHASQCSVTNRTSSNPSSEWSLGFCGIRLALSSPSRQLADTPRKSVWPDSRIIRPKHVQHLKSRPLISSNMVRGPGLTTVQHSLSSPMVLVGGHDHLARLLNLETNQATQVFRGHLHAVWSVALSPDGRTAVSGSEDKTLKYWDVASGKELDRFTAGGIFSCACYSADGSQVFATNWDRKVRVWRLSDGKSGKPLEFTFAAPTLGLALWPEQNSFVVGNDLGQILLCDAKTGAIRKTFEGHSGWVHSVAIVNEGNQILSASHDSTLRLWNVGTVKTERLYVGHSGLLNEVRVLPDGKRFVSCGADRTVRLWDITSRRLLAAGIGVGEYRGLSVAPDGKSCLTAGLDGSLWKWELPELTALSSDSTDEVIPILKTARAM